MARLPDPDNEETKKIKEELKRIFSLWEEIYGIEENYIPLEQDEQGVYGYKVLIHTPESPWFWSPNRYHNSEWVNRKLKAHYSPTCDRHFGIHATKNLEALKEWYDSYNTGQLHFRVFSVPYTPIVVKIRVWGCVVEHTKGLRAEYAEIMEVLKDGYW